MSASERSQSVAPDGVDQEEAVEQPTPLVNFEQPESEATALLLRSNWKFAAIVQFCRMFASPLRLRSFAADTLESALLTPDNHRMFLSELLFKLLRADASQPYSEKDSEGWESLLYRKVSAKWSDQFDTHPLAGTTFFEITSTERVGRGRPATLRKATPAASLSYGGICLQIAVLFALCDWRVQDCAAVKDVIKQLVSQSSSTNSFAVYSQQDHCNACSHTYYWACRLSQPIRPLTYYGTSQWGRTPKATCTTTFPSTTRIAGCISKSLHTERQTRSAEAWVTRTVGRP